MNFEKPVAPHSRLLSSIRDLAQPATPDRSTSALSPIASVLLPPLPSPEPIFRLPCGSQQHMLDLGNRSKWANQGKGTPLLDGRPALYILL